MATEVLMPKLGLTMTEGTLEEWKFQEGDTVKKGDVLFSVTTDKLTNDVEAEADGTLLKILLPEGETSGCKSVIAWIGEAGEQVPEGEGTKAAPPQAEATPAEPAADGPLATPVLMPKLGLTMTEGTLEEWKVKEGDIVKKGDILFSVTTDKLTNDVEADADGTLLKILLGEGETAACKSTIAWIGNPGDVIPAEGAVPETEVEAKAPAAAPVQKEAPQVTRQAGEYVLATPYAKKLAKEKGYVIHTEDGYYVTIVSNANRIMGSYVYVKGGCSLTANINALLLGDYTKAYVSDSSLYNRSDRTADPVIYQSYTSKEWSWKIGLGGDDWQHNSFESTLQMENVFMQRTSNSSGKIVYFNDHDITMKSGKDGSYEYRFLVDGVNQGAFTGNTITGKSMRYTTTYTPATAFTIRFDSDTNMFSWDEVKDENGKSPAYYKVYYDNNYDIELDTRYTHTFYTLERLFVQLYSKSNSYATHWAEISKWITVDQDTGDVTFSKDTMFYVEPIYIEPVIDPITGQQTGTNDVAGKKGRLYVDFDPVLENVYPFAAEGLALSVSNGRVTFKWNSAAAAGQDISYGFGVAMGEYTYEPIKGELSKGQTIFMDTEYTSYVYSTDFLTKLQDAFVNTEVVFKVKTYSKVTDSVTEDVFHLPAESEISVAAKELVNGYNTEWVGLYYGAWLNENRAYFRTTDTNGTLRGTKYGDHDTSKTLTMTLVDENSSVIAENTWVSGATYYNWDISDILKATKGIHTYRTIVTQVDKVIWASDWFRYTGSVEQIDKPITSMSATISGFNMYADMDRLTASTTGSNYTVSYHGYWYGDPIAIPLEYHELRLKFKPKDGYGIDPDNCTVKVKIDGLNGEKNSEVLGEKFGRRLYILRW